MLSPGQTFIAKAPESEKEHLYLILTERDENDKCYAVNITTLYSNAKQADSTVTLQRGEHPYISHASYVNFALATEIDLKALDLGISTRALGMRTDEDCSPALLERVRRGLLASPRTDTTIKARCAELWKCLL